MPRKIDLSGASKKLKVSVQRLQQLVNNYSKRRYKYIEAKVGMDSRSVWLHKEVITELFESNPEATGVRIYYGVIAEKDSRFKQGTHNLIFVATRRVGTVNEDMLDDNDTVLYLKNVSKHGATEPGGGICPPGPPECIGHKLQS